MANTNKLNGFWPVGHLMGIPWNSKIRVGYAAAANSTAIYKYDAIDLGTTAETLGMYPYVKQSATNEKVRGVALGFSNNPYISVDTSNLERKYRTASTALYVFFIDDPWVIYEVQSTGTTAADMVGANADLVVGTGSTTTGLSGMGLNVTDGTGSAQFRIIAHVNREDNELGAYGRFHVVINESEVRGVTGS